MSATCGKCHQTGVDAVHVRQCYGVGTRTRRPEYASQLATEGWTAEDFRPMALAEYSAHPFRSASTSMGMQPAIDQILCEHGVTVVGSTPCVPCTLAKAAPVEVPGAKYALPNPDGTVRCFQVDRPTKGKWAGWTFVKSLIGAPGDWRRARLARHQQEDVLAEIRSDEYFDAEASVLLRGPRAAAVRYAREHKRCSSCDAKLSDPQSQALGMGPVCAKRFL
jgi:hypothetical protein